MHRITQITTDAPLAASCGDRELAELCRDHAADAVQAFYPQAAVTVRDAPPPHRTDLLVRHADAAAHVAILITWHLCHPHELYPFRPEEFRYPLTDPDTPLAALDPTAHFAGTLDTPDGCFRLVAVPKDQAAWQAGRLAPYRVPSLPAPTSLYHSIDEARTALAQPTART